MVITLKPTEEQIAYAINLMEDLTEDNIENNSEEYQRITALSDEKLLEEFRYWRRIYSGLCPINIWAYEGVVAHLIGREISKRDLWKQAEALANIKNISCKECPLASGQEDRENPIDCHPTVGCIAWVDNVPLKE